MLATNDQAPLQCSDSHSASEVHGERIDSISRAEQLNVVATVVHLL